MHSILDAAIGYAFGGICVFPTHGSPDKKPEARKPIATRGFFRARYRSRSCSDSNLRILHLNL